MSKEKKDVETLQEGADTGASADASAPAVDVSSAVETDPRRIALTEAAHRWLRRNLSESPVSRDTLCWNTIHDAIPALVDELLKEGEGNGSE